jgi:hypothetical protein
MTDEEEIVINKKDNVELEKNLLQELLVPRSYLRGLPE